jgi:hypothetical protein
MRRSQAVVVSALGAVALGACGGGGDDAAPSQSPGGVIDTQQGTYRGVGLGDDVAAMHREFGPQEQAKEGERIVPRSVGEKNPYAPTVIRLTPPDSASPSQTQAYIYEYVVFLVRKDRIGAVIVNADGARVDGGKASIGGDLKKAEEAYPGLRCETAREDTEYEEFPACTGKLVQRRYVWFGNDPIRNVTLAVVPLEGI